MKLRAVKTGNTIADTLYLVRKISVKLTTIELKSVQSINIPLLVSVVVDTKMKRNLLRKFIYSTMGAKSVLVPKEEGIGWTAKFILRINDIQVSHLFGKKARAYQE